MDFAVFVVLLLAAAALTTTEAAKCSAGPSGATCRATCANKCFGQTNCDVDPCGIPRCVCNGYGDVDLITGRCACSSGTRAGDSCEYYTSGQCSQSQATGLYLPNIDFLVCNTGSKTTSCGSGSMQYSNPLVSELTGSAVCHPPSIGPVRLGITIGGTPYAAAVPTRRSLITLVDDGTTLEESFAWVYFRARSDTPLVFAIYSAQDQNRTLEVVTVNGVLTVAFSALQLQKPSLWLATGSDGVSMVNFFTLQSFDNLGNYLTVATALGPLSMSTNPSLSRNWVVRFRDSLVTTYSAPGAALDYIGSRASALTFSLPNPVAATNPLECLSHCQLDVSNCTVASWGNSQCWLAAYVAPGLPVALPTTTPGIAGYRTWIIQPRPFTAYPTRISATSCPVPGGGVSCSKVRIGPLRLESTLSSPASYADATQLALDISNVAVTTSSRSNSTARFSRNWVLTSVFGWNSNEYTIEAQDMAAQSLALDGHSDVLMTPTASGLTWYFDSLSSSTFRLTWTQTGTIALTLDVAQNPIAVVLASAGGWRFRMGDGPQRLLAGKTFASGIVNSATWLIERVYAPAVMGDYTVACHTMCFQRIACRAYHLVNSSASFACDMLQIPYTFPAPPPTTGSTTDVSSFMIQNEEPGYLGADCSSHGARDTTQNSIGGISYVGPSTGGYIYSSSWSRKYNVGSRCAKANSGPSYLTPSLTPAMHMMVARESVVSFSVPTSFSAGVWRDAEWASNGYSENAASNGLYYNHGVPQQYESTPVIFLSTGDRDGPNADKVVGGIWHIYNADLRNRSLEIDPHYPVYGGDGTISWAVGFREVINARPARWKVRKPNVFTQGAGGAPELIESVEHPGLLLTIISGTTTRVLGVAANENAEPFYRSSLAYPTNSANSWAFGVGLQLTDPGVASTGTTSSIPDMESCEGLALEYRATVCAEFDFVALTCQLFRLFTLPDGHSNPDPTITRHVKSGTIVSIVTGVQQAYHLHAPIVQQCTFNDSEFGLSVVRGIDIGSQGSPTYIQGYCQDITCVSQRQTHDWFGCHGPAMVTHGALISDVNTNAFLVPNTPQNGYLIVTGTDTYEYCLHTPPIDSNPLFIPTIQCLYYDPSSGKALIGDRTVFGSASLLIPSGIGQRVFVNFANFAGLASFSVQLESAAHPGLFLVYDVTVAITSARFAPLQGTTAFTWTYYAGYSTVRRGLTNPDHFAATPTPYMEAVLFLDYTGYDALNAGDKNIEGAAPASLAHGLAVSGYTEPNPSSPLSLSTLVTGKFYTSNPDICEAYLWQTMDSGFAMFYSPSLGTPGICVTIAQVGWIIQANEEAPLQLDVQGGTDQPVSTSRCFRRGSYTGQYIASNLANLRQTHTSALFAWAVAPSTVPNSPWWGIGSAGSGTTISYLSLQASAWMILDPLTEAYGTSCCGGQNVWGDGLFVLRACLGHPTTYSTYNTYATWNWEVNNPSGFDVVFEPFGTTNGHGLLVFAYIPLTGTSLDPMHWWTASGLNEPSAADLSQAYMLRVTNYMDVGDAPTVSKGVPLRADPHNAYNVIGRYLCLGNTGFQGSTYPGWASPDGSTFTGPIWAHQLQYIVDTQFSSLSNNKNCIFRTTNHCQDIPGTC